MVGLFDVLLILFFAFLGLFAIVALALFNFFNLALRLIPPIALLIIVRRIRRQENKAPWFAEFSRTQLLLGLTVFPLVLYFAAIIIVVASFGVGYYYDAHQVSNKFFTSLRKNANKTNFTGVLSEMDKHMNYTEFQVEMNKSTQGIPADPKVFEPLGFGIGNLTENAMSIFSNSYDDITPYLDRFNLKPSVILVACVLISAIKVVLIWCFGRRMRKHWKRKDPFVLDDAVVAFLLPLAGLQFVGAFLWAAKDTALGIGPIWNWISIFLYTCTDIAGALLLGMAVYERCLNPVARNVEMYIVFVTAVTSLSRYAETMWVASNTVRIPALLFCSIATAAAYRKARSDVHALRYYRLRSSSLNGE